MSEVVPLRIRKCLSAMRVQSPLDIQPPIFTPNAERKAYFYCLKMLGILPPPPGSGFQNWSFFSAANKWIKPTEPSNPAYYPKSLHDVLIASHATGCEHHSLYFSFYHRHLMILFEIFLNFAHSILKKGYNGGLPVLKAIYPAADFPELITTANEHMWKAVFDTYATFKDIPDQMAAHYWDPTNYKSPENLKIPQELRRNSYTKDHIDILYKNINKAFPWDLYAPRRWYNNQNEFQRSQMDGFFDIPQADHPDPSYIPYSEKLSKGEFDPRKKQNAQIFINSGLQIGRLMENTMKHNSIKICEQRNQNNFNLNQSNIMILNSISEDQSLAIYGSEKKHTQYITPEQQFANGLDSAYVIAYNNSVLHYQYANALYNTSLENFFKMPTEGMEVSHDNGHDYFGFILNDGNFSITSFIFWPYHSWIDYAIEVRLRKGGSGSNTSDYHYLKGQLDKFYTAATTPLRDKVGSNFGNLEAFMSKLSNLQISIPSPISPQHAGYYPITEWIQLQRLNNVGTLQAISAGFCSRDLILTIDQKVRSSFRFNQAYKKYLEVYTGRFSFFPEINQINFSYNYQVGANIDDIKTLLSPTADNLPPFLTNMSGMWKRKQDRMKAVTEKAFSRSRYIANLNVKDTLAFVQEHLSVRKVLLSTVRLFASYPSNTPNGPNLVFLKVKNILGNIDSKEFSEEQFRQLEKYIIQGICIHNIFIFGKGNLAEQCHKCKKNKVVFVDLDDRLREMAPRIWKYIHLHGLNKYLYDSENPSAKLHCINSKFDLKPNKTFTDYRLIRGAEEIEIEVKAKVTSVKRNYIRIDAESYSVEANAVENVLSKKYENFNKSFDFYKIFDVNTRKNKSYFDNFVYKSVRFYIEVDGRSVEGHFQIPNFQRLLRLTLNITSDEKCLHVSFEDSDYDLKKTYYEVAFSAISEERNSLRLQYHK